MSSPAGHHGRLTPRPAASDPQRQDARTFKALHEIAIAIAPARDFDELSRRVTRHTCDLLAADSAVLDFCKERAGVVRNFAERPAAAASVRDALRLGQGIAGQTAQRREILIVEDYPNWEHAVPLAIQGGIRSAIAAPLLVGDRLIGGLTAHFKTPYSSSTRRLKF